MYSPFHPKNTHSQCNEATIRILFVLWRHKCKILSTTIKWKKWGKQDETGRNGKKKKNWKKKTPKNIFLMFLWIICKFIPIPFRGKYYYLLNTATYITNLVVLLARKLKIQVCYLRTIQRVFIQKCFWFLVTLEIVWW